MEHIDGPEEPETNEYESEYDNVESADYRSPHQKSFDKNSSDFEEPTMEEQTRPKTKRLAKRGTARVKSPKGSKKEAPSQSLDNDASYLTAGGSGIKRSQSSSQPNASYFTAQTHLESSDLSGTNAPRDESNTSFDITHTTEGAQEKTAEDAAPEYQARVRDAILTADEDDGKLACRFVFRTGSKPSKHSMQVSTTTQSNPDPTSESRVRESDGAGDSLSDVGSTFESTERSDSPTATIIHEPTEPTNQEEGEISASQESREPGDETALSLETVGSEYSEFKSSGVVSRVHPTAAGSHVLAEKTGEVNTTGDATPASGTHLADTDSVVLHGEITEPSDDTSGKVPASTTTFGCKSHTTTGSVVIDEEMSKPDDYTNEKMPPRITNVSDSQSTTDTIVVDENVENFDDETSKQVTQADTKVSVTHEDDYSLVSKSKLTTEGEKSGDIGGDDNAIGVRPSREADYIGAQDIQRNGKETQEPETGTDDAVLEENVEKQDDDTCKRKTAVGTKLSVSNADDGSQSKVQMEGGKKFGDASADDNNAVGSTSNGVNRSGIPGSQENKRGNRASETATNNTVLEENMEELDDEIRVVTPADIQISVSHSDGNASGSKSKVQTEESDRSGVAGADDENVVSDRPNGTVDESRTQPRSAEEGYFSRDGASSGSTLRAPQQQPKESTSSSDAAPASWKSTEESGEPATSAEEEANRGSKSLDTVSKGAETRSITHVYKQNGGVVKSISSTAEDDENSEPQMYLDDEIKTDKMEPLQHDNNQMNYLVPNSAKKSDRNSSRDSKPTEMGERCAEVRELSINAERNSGVVNGSYSRENLSAGENKVGDHSRLDPSDICDLKKIRRNHHTDRFEDNLLIVRRGFPIQLFKKGINEVKLVKVSNKFAKRESEENVDEFHREFVLSFANKEAEFSGWKLTRSEEGITLHIVPNAIVGEWQLFVDKKGPYDFIVLFNPWCEKDLVYMENEEDAETYVLDDAGYIFTKGERKRSWYFGQFDEGVLSIVLELLNRSYLTAWGKASPIRVCRALTSILNFGDDNNGLLVGQWSKPYKGGKNPTYWDGSTEILLKYRETGKSIKFAQCWVFSGCLATMLKCLGIPCRVVTCTGSFNDNNGNLVADMYFDEDGKLIDHESTWAFHVWNEVWMRRPDVQPNYDGWQAVDSTPEEKSRGLFREGPAPVKAVKAGQVYVLYDTGVVFAQVNADRASWERNRKGDYTLLKVKNSPIIGRSILTSRRNSKEAEDITSNYKAMECSEEEKRRTRQAVHFGTEPNIYNENQKKDSVKIESDLPGHIAVGRDLKFQISVTPVDENEKLMGKFAVACNILSYNGKVLHKLFHDKREIMIPGDLYQGVVAKQEYRDFVDDENVLHFTIQCKSKSQDEATVECYMVGFDAQSPEVNMIKGPPYFVDQEIPLRLSYENDTGKTLNKCFFKMTAPGIKDRAPYHLRKPLEPQERRQINVKYTPKRAGKITMVVSFGCKEFPIRSTNHDITVKN